MSSKEELPAPDPNWTRLGSRPVGDFRVVRVREDRYRFEPTGREGDFFICESRDWVLIVAVTTDDQLILVRQFRHGTAQTVLEVPGGIIDPGETPEEAAVRELREETGYRAGRVRHVASCLANPALMTTSCRIVLAEDCRPDGPQQPDPMEDIEVRLYPRQELPELIRTGQFPHALAIAAVTLVWGLDPV